MTKPKFTEGPWNIRRDGDVFDVMCGDNSICVCSLADQIDVSEDEANARLIAKAPEMYEMLSLYLLGEGDGIDEKVCALLDSIDNG